MASAPPMEEDQNVFRSLETPFVSSIVGGLFPGRAIEISGMVLGSLSSNPRRFVIDLFSGVSRPADHMESALRLHASFQTPSACVSSSGELQVSQNLYISNEWGDDELVNNSFEEGKPFQMRILVLDQKFKIAVNGKHLCDYVYRVPIDKVNNIFINGNIRLIFVDFQPALNVLWFDRPMVVKPNEREERTTVMERPADPFSYNIPHGGFLSPQTLRITLTPLTSANLFAINLMGCGEFFFHFKVYFANGTQQVAVVRNSTSLGGWRKEERQMGKFPFNKGLTHDIVLHAYGRSVAVDVDGMPFVKFQYREGDDPVNIDRVTVEGDIVVNRFVVKPNEREERTTVMERPAVPFSYNMPHVGFLPPQTLLINLTPLNSANTFAINLMSGNDFTLHFKVCYVGESQLVVVCNNSWFGQWYRPIREVRTMPFEKDDKLNIEIRGDHFSLKVYINDSPFYWFGYREIDDAMNIDRVTVEGDVVLNRFTYSAVQHVFPKTTGLDEIEVMAKIGGDANEDDDTSEPLLKPGFYGSDEVRQLVETFIVEFFKQYDGEDSNTTRKNLLDAYDKDNSKFSLTIAQLHDSKHVKYDNDLYPTYIKLNHSFMVLDQYVKYRKDRVHRGAMDIAVVLSKLPITNHYMESFVVDVHLVSPKLLGFTVQGLFEDGKFATGNEVPRLSYFSRSFIVRPCDGGSVAVLSDMLYISAIIPERVARYKLLINKCIANDAKVSQPQIPTQQVQAGVPTEDIRQQMVAQFSKDSGMLPEWSLKCLEDSNWNYQVAGEQFMAMKDQIPREAFTGIQ